MYIQRTLEKTIQPFLKRREAVAILGPRQAGKTTFIKYLEKEFLGRGKKVKFLTFEKSSDRELFEESIDDFKALIEDYQYVIIDEFQYAKEGGQKLKYLFDTTKVKFIISGSSSLELTFQTGKYMVGRMFNFELLPFSFREYLLAKDKDLYNLLEKKNSAPDILSFNIKNGFSANINQRLTMALEDYAIYGGYPAVVLSKTKKEKQKTLESIIDKYFLQDIRGLLQLATDDKLLRLSKFLATQASGMVKFEELSRVSDLSYQDILKHLNILEKTFIIKLVKPFFKNKRTELTKNPKIYFYDLGVRNFLISDFRPLGLRNDAGAIMENHAFGALIKSGVASNPKYWRTKSKAEVDFVIEKERSIYPVEIKYSSERIIGKSFYSFLEKFPTKTGIILTKDYLGEEKIGKTKIKFIPLSYF